MYKYSELLVSVFLNWRPIIEDGRTSVAYSISSTCAHAAHARSNVCASLYWNMPSPGW